MLRYQWINQHDALANGLIRLLMGRSAMCTQEQSSGITFGGLGEFQESGESAECGEFLKFRECRGHIAGWPTNEGRLYTLLTCLLKIQSTYIPVSYTHLTLPTKA